MRTYQLTPRGRQVAKVPSGRRDPIMDQLYPNKKVPKDELAAIVGPNRIEESLRYLTKKGYIEEVRNDF